MTIECGPLKPAEGLNGAPGALTVEAASNRRSFASLRMTPYLMTRPAQDGTSLHDSSLDRGTLTKQRCHYLGDAGQCGVELIGVFASGFGHVGAASAGSSDLFGHRRDDLSGLEFAGEVFGDSDDDRDLAVFLHGAEDDDAGA